MKEFIAEVPLHWGLPGRDHLNFTVRVGSGIAETPVQTERLAE